MGIDRVAAKRRCAPVPSSIVGELARRSTTVTAAIRGSLRSVCRLEADLAGVALERAEEKGVARARSKRLVGDHLLESGENLSRQR